MEVCAEKVFTYHGPPEFIIVIMVLGAICGLYLTVRMCRLCFSAFSYANFHIHETYKFYAMALISIAFTVFFHKNQYDYAQFCKDETEYSIDILKGFQTLYVLFGIISNYCTELLYIFNGLTWLLITLGCDYSSNDIGSQSKISAEQYASTIHLRRKLQIAKISILYITIPILMVFSTIGVLQQVPSWCRTTAGTVVASSVITLATFIGGAGSFLIKRRLDPTVSLRTKISIGYLLLTISFRQIYLIVSVMADSPMFDQEYAVIAFNIMCILMPLLVMSLLSQRQLQKQKCALLKSSQIFLFKSIVV